ncbi:MAG: hypothetical protein LBF40_07170, partial [Deltaproteobacteria bacterium]|nr:hypothetical protein [Deltaproteobacteria bacterium]
PSRSIILVYQDTYVLGRGYLGNTKLRVPGKYLLQGFSYSGAWDDIPGDPEDGIEGGVGARGGAREGAPPGSP